MTEVTKGIAEIAGRLAETYLGGSIDSAKAIMGRGEVNQMYLLETAEQKAVLRVNGVGEYDRFKKEEWCIHQANARGVPSPKVLALGTDSDRAYMLLEHVDGANGNEIASTPELWEQLGRYLRGIHDIPVQGFGESLEDITAGSRATWQKYLTYNITSLTDEDVLVRTRVLDAVRARELRAQFERLSAAVFSFGLSHGDFSLANVIVAEDHRPNVIDWGSAQGHIVPHHDLGVILDESVSENSDQFSALLAGYDLRRPDFEKLRDDILALQLLEAVDKVRWALEKAPDRVPHHASQVAKFLKRAHL